MTCMPSVIDPTIAHELSTFVNTLRAELPQIEWGSDGTSLEAKYKSWINRRVLVLDNETALSLTAWGVDIGEVVTALITLAGFNIRQAGKIVSVRSLCAEAAAIVIRSMGYNKTAAFFIAIVYGAVAVHDRYQQRHGMYPVNTTAYMRDYLEHGEDYVLSREY